MAYYPPQPQQFYSNPPNPSHNPVVTGPRTLHVYHEGLTHRHIRILDSDRRTPIYTISSHNSLFSSKPHMRISDGASNAEIATITFHSLSSNIDLTIHDRPILLSKGLWSSAYKFRSLVTEGMLKWRRDGVFSGGSVVCVDERGQTMARFEDSGWAMKKEGRFELAPGVGGVLMTELVVSGVAMVAYIRSQTAAEAAGAAGGAC